MDESVDGTTYNVVVDRDERYSLWPADRTAPDGWAVVALDPDWSARYRADNPPEPGVGNKDECLAYMETLWKDMRPMTFRKMTYRGA